ncbi:hypothetical protein XX58_002210 [Salmonella enterica subsp. salamae]|uniref:Uncharacterized protein n=3 Tax=Salmonella enterica TaxID=28901 RepID=A0A603KZE8_SALER|nr:hypothetical protein [Salmonella enterica]EAA6247310.1 hypothetical protein [Salmonella enterica subsp. salamae]EBP3808950.1 hypothetical protein [Salmonella enterica subsp. enterica]ECG6590736.1 hypothetical protein [Salmonella enterica subsp. enterica serovar Newport]EKR2156258.1 hypothetical protein [Salmonella enterica subsp. salamae serovar 40:c:z6]HCM1898680.1 hypothetical protein [Salmonella enterica subsp. salamae serovar 58:c:z6]
MDESRNQFEEWFKNKYHVSSDVMKIMHIKSEIAWEAWQASRAAIEIELPAKNDITGDDYPIPDLVDWDDGRNAGIQKCAEAIRAAGIKVKE